MERKLTVARTSYPWHLRALDAAGGALTRFTSLGTLDRDSILGAARRATGLQDWGDEGFLEGMDVILDNANRLPFTNLARIFIRATYVKAVVNRLRLQAALAADPGIRDIPIRKPVFVLGFPRSGTTVLQNLLAAVPGRRGLPFWELITPLPVHPDPATDRARRLRTAQVALGAGYLMAPEMGAVHHVTPDSLEECWYLFCNSFAVLNWDIQTGLTDYGQWLLHRSDMRRAYAEYRTWLQVLLRHHPADTLLLKCPEHLWFLDDLLAVFPDACIVWTHRDPVASVASYCSLMSLTRRTLYGVVDPHALGELVTHRFHEGVTRAMAAADRADPSRFFHVDFDRLTRDPVGVTQEIVRHFDLEDPPDHAALLQATLDAPRHDELGKHVYSARMFGLEPDKIQAMYADYIARYGIRCRADHG
jgi:hypothetical protein